MIDSLFGVLIKKDPTFIIVDMNGFRLKVFITVGFYENLPPIGDKVEVLTYLHVKEDILDLYGFSDYEQREIFGLLTAVNGIGPRSALGILSGVKTEDLRKRISTGDVKSLTLLPGIGPKIAKRIIVELKEKFDPKDLEDISGIAELSPMSDKFKDSLNALQALGFHRSKAFKALKSLEDSGDLDNKLEDIIKIALTKMR